MMKMSVLHLQSSHPDIYTGRNGTCNRFMSLLYDLYARFLRVHQVLRDYIRYIRRKRLLAEHGPPALLAGRSV
ncbi:MAG: hypothetical protein LKE44_02035 [Eubacterium sp.]|jgi:hypothetical protein|nr:hypothetical protein [Eubacterium sp.]